MSTTRTRPSLPPGIEPLLTAEQVAAWLGVGVKKVNEHRKAGRLVAIAVESHGRPGGRRGWGGYRYEPSAVRAFLENRRILEVPAAEEAAATRPVRRALPPECGGVDPLRGKGERRRSRR
jgi:hypothetical protein